MRRPEGPFGDHYGYYSLKHDYPVFEVDRVFRRRDAIFPATVVGKPAQEDFYIGDYLQELLSPLFPVVMPSVVDLWSYGDTGFHSLAAAVVKDRYGREAISSAFRILGEGQLALTKFLLLTDVRVDLKDFRALLETVLARCRFETDLFVVSNLAMDTLDYTGPKVNEGSKGVLAGLGAPIRDLPREFRGALPAGARAAAVFCGGALCVSGPSWNEDRDFASRLARRPGGRGVAPRRPRRRRGGRREGRALVPLARLHPLRAGSRRPRRPDGDREEPDRPFGADRPRRADEALDAGRRRGRPRDRRPGRPPLAGVLPRGKRRLAALTRPDVPSSARRRTGRPAVPPLRRPISMDIVIH